MKTEIQDPSECNLLEGKLKKRCESKYKINTIFDDLKELRGVSEETLKITDEEFDALREDSMETSWPDKDEVSAWDNQIDPHEPGAKLDHNKPRVGLVLDAFSQALEQVSNVGTMGANKYSDNGWLEVPNGINRYTDAMLRHHLKHAQGEDFDEESGLLHLAHQAWNALAVLELALRERR